MFREDPPNPAPGCGGCLMIVATTAATLLLLLRLFAAVLA